MLYRMRENQEAIKRVEIFMAHEFEKHPHYSFDDWTVMRDHSFKVRDLAMQISSGMSVDTTVVAIGALLHDIGKTHKTEAEVLHRHHEEFNLPVSEAVLDTLGLPSGQLKKLKEVVRHKSDSDEMRIIEDADALALYADKRLYTLFINWARENHLNSAIQRKLDKFNRLNFRQSKDLGRDWYQQMVADWKV